MKNLKLLLAALIVVVHASCRTPLSHVTYYIDYQEASQGKLFISEANSVAFEYEPLGSILVEEMPGYTKTTLSTPQEDSDELYGTIPANKTVSSYTHATAQTALNYAASKAIAMGGDGLINLKLTSYYQGNECIVQVSGMVIKRK